MMAETSKNFTKKTFYKVPIKITGLLIVSFGIVAGVFLVQRVQDIRSKAADTGAWQGPTESYSPPSGFNKIIEGGKFSVDVGVGEVIILSNDNDPKWKSGCVLEKGHMFIIDGVEDVVPWTETECPTDPPDNEKRWKMFNYGGGTIAFDRREDSGQGTVYFKAGTIPTPTPTLTPTPTPTPTSIPTPTIIPSISPTPTPYIIILTEVLHDGAVGKGYTGFFVAEARDYNFDPTLTITAFGLPPGLTASTDRCLVEYIQNPSSLIVQAISCPLDGIPTVDGDYTVLVTVTDDFGLSESKSIPLKVIKSVPPGGCLPGFLPGDGNGDCTVDGLDYGIWFTNYNQQVVGEAADGDYDLSGFVDGFDYGIWFINFGKTVAPP